MYFLIGLAFALIVILAAVLILLLHDVTVLIKKADGLRQADEAMSISLIDHDNRIRDIWKRVAGLDLRAINTRLDDHRGKLEVLKDAALGHLNAHIRDINERKAAISKKVARKKGRTVRRTQAA